MTFVDDKSRMAWTFLLTHKSEAFDVFLEWKAMVELQTEKKLKTVRSDNGGEYLNLKFGEFMTSTGITHQFTIPHTPEQNGVAERWNRTLLEMARSMIQGAGVHIPICALGRSCGSCHLHS